MPGKTNTEEALGIWNKAEPIKGTETEAYLNHRGITDFNFNDVRHHPKAKHYPSNQEFPMMVVAVRKWPNNDLIGIQRTYLMPDGGGKAPVEDPKKSLGKIAGGAVQLHEPAELLVVAEGVENALSVHQATGYPTWAVLGSANLQKLVIPETVKKIFIAADNDENGVGLNAARKAAAEYYKTGIEDVRIVLPLEQGKDFNDMAQDGNAGGIEQAFREATTVERAVSNGSDKSGSDLEETLKTPEAWPHPINGGELADALVADLKEYVSLGSYYAEAIIGWVFHTYFLDLEIITPRLFITAATKGSGKTTVLNWLKPIAYKGHYVSSYTGAYLDRTIEKHRPTFHMDEADTVMQGEKAEAIRNIINSGFDPEGTTGKCDGPKNEPRDFSTYCAMAIAGNGLLNATILDRSIIIKMKKKHAGELVKKLRQKKRKTEVAEYSSMLTRYAADNSEPLEKRMDELDEISETAPLIDEGLGNRYDDVWISLIALADLWGGRWPQKMRKAARHLCKEIPDEQDLHLQLLADINIIFQEMMSDDPNKTYIYTKDLIEKLVAMEDRPWREFKRNNDPMNPNDLARLLKKIDPLIVSQDIKRKGQNRKGFRWEQFEDEVKRLIRPPRGNQSATPLPTSVSAGYSQNGSATPVVKVADEKPPKATDTNGSSEVAGDAPLAEDEVWVETIKIEKENQEATAATEKMVRQEKNIARKMEEMWAE